MRARRKRGAGGVHKARGFTLIELSIVLIILGLLVAAGVGVWSDMVPVRKYAQTVSVLKQVKACLVKRAYVSERYPTYTANLDCGTNYSATRDVDYCLCQPYAKDAWDKDIYFLAGYDSTSAGFNGQYLVTDEARDQTRSEPHANSQVTDRQGAVRTDMAFTLISFGADGVPDGAPADGFTSGYYGAFNANMAVRARPFSDTTGTVDFSQATDVDKKDVELVVTSYELLSQIAR